MKRNFIPPSIQLVVLMLSILFASCASKDNKPTARLDKKKEADQIHSLMSKQESAWNNADLDGFMFCYWKSDSLKFIGKRGITYGWQATLENYKKSYATPDEMGKLKFTNLTTDILSDSSAFVIGKWQLLRTADTLSGHYTLLWKKINQHWVIIADHSS